MRKKLLLVLLLVVCLVVQALPVTLSATSMEDQVKALPKPGADDLLISWSGLRELDDGSYEFIPEGDFLYLSNYVENCKVLEFQPSTGEFWYTVIEVTEVPGYGDEMMPMESRVDKSTDNPNAVLSTMALTDRGYSITVDNDMDAYLIFLPSDATSLSDAMYACKVPDLLNHVYNPYKKDTGKELNNKVSVTLLEKLTYSDRVTGARYRFDYDLEGYASDGVIREEHGLRIIVDSIDYAINCTESSKKGSVEFVISNLMNQEYTAYLVTDGGNKYYTTFVVDFADTESRDAYDGSWEKPVVTFDGLPDANSGAVSSPLLVTMHSDIPAIMVFNGATVTSGYQTEAEITIPYNGTFYYSATTPVGQQTNGSIEVSKIGYVDSYTPNGTNLSAAGNGLAQTGEEREELESGSSSAVIVALSSFAIILVAIGCFVMYRKRGGKSAISVLLLTALIISGCVSTAYAFSGESDGKGSGAVIGHTVYVGGATSGGGGRNQGDGFVSTVGGIASRGSYCIRIMAVPLRDKNPEQAYFYFAEGNKIDMKEPGELIRAADYNNVNKWLYFSNSYPYGDASTDGANEFHFMIQAFGADEAHMVKMWKPNSSKYNEFIKLCGKTYSGQALTNADVLNSLLMASRNNYFDDQEHRVALGMFLGLSAEEAQDFYIVVEQIRYAHQYLYGYGFGRYGYLPVNMLVDGVLYHGSIWENPDNYELWEWKAAETYATAYASDTGYPCRELQFVFGESGAVGMGGFKWRDGGESGALYWATSQIYWTQGAEAPFPNYTMGKTKFTDQYLGTEHTFGYSLYSFTDLEVGQTGANVTVEYQGDVNTSDANKFVGTASIITDGSPSSYYDFNSGSWKDSGDHGELLRFAPIDTSEYYSIIWASADKYGVESDIPITTALSSAFGSALTSGGYDLTWGEYPVDGGDINVGNTYKVLLIDGVPNTSPIKSKFETAIAAAGSGSLSYIGGSDTSEEYAESTNILEACWQNFSRAASLSSPDVLQDDITYRYLKDQEQLGVGYEFIVRGNPVKSKKITFTVIVDQNMTVLDVKQEQTWLEEYTTLKKAKTQISPDSLAWRVITGEDNSGVTSSIEGRLWSQTDFTGDGLYRTLESGGGTTRNGGTWAGFWLMLGSEGEPPEGYTVYEVIVEDENGERIPVIIPPGAEELPAYMINRYFDNVIQHSSARTPSGLVYYTLNKDKTWIKWNQSYATCGQGPFNTSWENDWVIEYKDLAASAEFGYDNNKLRRYYPTATGVWDQAERLTTKLKGDWVVKIDTKYLFPPYPIVDYGFNLLREYTGDKRAFSGISYQTYVNATGDGDNMLRIQDVFGVVPNMPHALAVTPRDSMSAVSATGVWPEQFNIKSRFTYYAASRDGIGYYVQDNQRFHDHWVSQGYSQPYWTGSGIGYRWIDTSYNCGPLQYYLDEDLQDYEAHGFQVVRAGGASPVNSITYTFNNVVYKYETLIMPAGWNEKLGQNGDHDSVSVSNAHGAETGRVKSTDAYRFAYVRYNNATLKYYPETYMIFKVGQTKMETIKTQEFKYGYVMGETQRTAKSSSMYFFKINTQADGATVTSFPGTVYSDSMQGGGGQLGTSLVSIPAGSDVTVAVNMDGIKIDLYGYALDIVQTSDGGKIGATNRPFNDVVKSGQDVYGRWGNGSRDIIDRDFEEWTQGILDIKNFGADLKLYVDGSFKSENFSATVGRIDQSTATIKQEGVYQLVVEKGRLQTGKGDYQALLKQIAKDYFSDESKVAQAAQVFEDSGIYQTIINAMETCKNDVNNSGRANQHESWEGPDWTDVLGGDGNWYDETSRTFVIRRYTYEGSQIKDVVAEDKIDYQLAPTATNPSGGENANSNLRYLGKWEVSVFFDRNGATNVNDLLLNYTGNGNFYNPNGGPNLSVANSKYTVLVDSVYVNGADFYIPASSTQDFYN